MSRAQRWRICLIGGPTTINLLRRTKIQMKKRSIYFDEIQKDNTWQLLFDGIELLEGEVEIPEIVFNRKYSNGEFFCKKF